MRNKKARKNEQLFIYFVAFLHSINKNQVAFISALEEPRIPTRFPKKNSSFKAYLDGTKKVDTYWEKQEGVSGYQIQYSTSSSFSSKKSKTLDGNKTSYSFKVSKKKTYYVRIRSYVLIGSEKYYGAWKKVKIKVK